LARGLATAAGDPPRPAVRRGRPLPDALHAQRAARARQPARAGAPGPRPALAAGHAEHAQGPSLAAAAGDRLELREHLLAVGPPLRDLHAPRGPRNTSIRIGRL